MAVVAAVRRKASALPAEDEVAALVRRAAEVPCGMTAAEIWHLGDVAVRQAQKVAALLRRLAELVEGERAAEGEAGHG